MKATLAVLTMATLAAVAGPALARNDAYCLQAGKWGYPGNCQFSTYRQCVEAASGTSSTCGRNPMRRHRYDRSVHQRR
ncbi:DUF3551 domain-containing protein [Nitrobacter sp. TKz-YC01]